MDRSIAFASRTVGGVPLLLAFPQTGEAPHPTVLWFHGFGVDKEVHHKELEHLARGPGSWRWAGTPWATPPAACRTWTPARPHRTPRRYAP